MPTLITRRSFLTTSALTAIAASRLPAGEPTGPSGRISLENRASGAFLSIAADQIHENFGRAEQWDYLGPTATRQQFLLHTTSEKDVYKLESRASAKLLCVDGSHAGEDVCLCVQWDDHGLSDSDPRGFHQRWRFEALPNGFYKITSRDGGKALAVDYFQFALRGGRVITWTYDGGGGLAHFQWRIRTW